MLNEEQRAQIERNRLEALKRLAERKSRISVAGDTPNGVVGLKPQSSGHSDLAADLSKLAPMKRPASVATFSDSTAKKTQPPKSESIPATGLKPKLQLTSPNTVSVTATQSVRRVCQQSIPQSVFDARENQMTVPLMHLNALIDALPPSDRPVAPNVIPKTVLSFFDAQSMAVRRAEIAADYRVSAAINPELYEALFPYQKEGVHAAIARRGRIMLADEMGLGKSIQAIAIASYYRREWPLLIIAPASMVASWHVQILQWLPELSEENLAVIYDGKAVDMSRLVTILSYDLATKLVELLENRRFRVAIVDECHALRNMETKRSKTLVPLLKGIERVIMLSGTPALSRPMELFPQLQVINPRLFPKLHEYGLRYCNGRQTLYGWDWRGHSNSKELHVILEQLIMIRRMKSQVLNQLPRKIRHQIYLKVSNSSHDYKMFELQAAEFNSHLLADDLNDPMAVEAALNSMGKRAEYMALWRKSGELKLPAMIEYVEDLLEGRHKMLIFGHHQTILDGFEQHLLGKKTPYIRIDGRTPTSERQNLCTKFQSEDEVRIALLSITAASTGLTLTKASTVIFAEIFFNPGVLVQAEDRAHRIGQVDSVNVHYLLAKGTTDDKIWPIILRKLNILESVGLGKNDFKDMASRDHEQGQSSMDRWLTKAPAASHEQEPSP